MFWIEGFSRSTESGSDTLQSTDIIFFVCLFALNPDLSCPVPGHIPNLIDLSVAEVVGARSGES